MVNARGYAVSYNGEIYNYVELRRDLAAAGYQFQTTSDTEVILAGFELWGDQAVSRFRGMFAFALLDPRRSALVLVRDRFGVKPLFFASDRRRLWFSSTALPLAEVVNAVPNEGYAGRGLRTLSFDDGTDESPYVGVSALRPGHLYVVSLADVALQGRLIPFYDLRSAVASTVASTPVGDDAAVIRAGREKLEEAVRIRLRADVPVALTLSGGLDSGVLAAVAVREIGSVVAYCFGHPSAPWTEAEPADEVARCLGIDLRWVYPNAGEMRDIFWSTVEAQEAPFASFSIVAQHAVYRAVRRDGFRVVLGGQGGDEVFLGYRKAIWWQLGEAARTRRASPILRSVVGLAKLSTAELVNARVYLRRVLQRHVWPNMAAASGWMADPSWRRSGGDDVRARQMWDLQRGGLPTLLRYDDRNSMANSVESRLPFMDHGLVEWGLALPTSFKVRDGYGKWILRQIAADLLPRRTIQRRRKRGFDVRAEGWLEAGLGDEIRQEVDRLRPLLSSVGIGVPGPTRPFSNGRLAHGRLGEASAAIWLGRALERGLDVGA